VFSLRFASKVGSRVDGFLISDVTVTGTLNAVQRVALAPAPVPLPATGLMLLTGVLGFGAYRRFKS
jgi:hypothetical protein